MTIRGAASGLSERNNKPSAKKKSRTSKLYFWSGFVKEQLFYSWKSSLLSFNPAGVCLLSFPSFNVSVLLIAGIGFCLSESIP
jgi:hypothetical protein